LDINAFFQLSLLVIVSVLFHSALFLGIKYDNKPGYVTPPALDMVLVDVAKAKPIVEPVIEKKTKKPAIQHRKKLTTNVVKQETHSIRPIKIEEQRSTASAPKLELQRPKPLSKKEVGSIGAELVNRAFDFVQTQPQNEKTMQIFNPLTRNLKNNALSLNSSPEIKSGTHSYKGLDGRTKVTFTSLDGKVICAEIREKDPLDAFDYGIWYMLLNGCGE